MLKKINENYNKILLYITFALPFLDMYRALIGNKIELLGISLVEIFNFAFAIIIFSLLCYKCILEKKKIFSSKMLLLIILYCFYIAIHSIYIVSLKNVTFINYNMSIFKEVYYILRAYILPLIILFVYMRSELKSNEIIHILSKISFIFSLIIVITNVVGISLVAYSSNYEGVVRIKGNIFSWFSGMDINSIDLYTSRGLFYSTNQISAILGGLLFISSFYTLYKDKISYYLSYFIKILAAIMLSTKTAFFAIIFSIIAIYVYALLKYILNKEKVLTKKSFLFLIFLVFISFIYCFSPIRYKLEGYVNNLNNYETNEFINNELSNGCISEDTLNIQENSNLDLNKIMKKKKLNSIEKNYLVNYINDCPNQFNIPESYIKFYPIDKNFDFWFTTIKKPISFLSNYRKFKESIYYDYIYKHNNNMDKWFGIGYSSEFPYLEVDFLGQNIWVGYFGTLLFILPYILILLLSIIMVIFNLKKKLNIISVSLILSSLFMICASIFAGHVFGIVLPSTILALELTGLYNEAIINEKNNNKISFLLLHLGYGGIESSTINTANSLIDDYEIELMSFYKLSKNQSAKIDKRIKIKYLYDGEPNREEFKESLRQHKYFKTIKEGFKAINILIKKKLLVIDYIYNCDSKFIVSTRWDFSILLSKYGNKDTVKIAQEHHYHNNDKKYINTIKKKYKKIDYLFALTKTLEDDYNEFLKKNKHTKVVLVPNMLESIPDDNSKLKEKNIITVSRLDYGKKNDDIIKAFSKLKDNEWKLYIIGDGNEYNNLLSLVDELKLNNRVILTGYKNKKEIEKYMLKSSLFLMASLTEGLPMVLLEAMSYGVPCIAYETASGVSDIISNNENGYVIKNRDEKEYIEKIEKIISDTELRNKLGKEAKKSVYNFSNESITKIWKEILK